LTQTNDELKFVRLDPPEKRRTYVFPGCRVGITDVVAVCVRPSGSHRLETADGMKWIIQPGWLAIEIDTPKWTF
jgi:hypothetical protein